MTVPLRIKSFVSWEGQCNQTFYFFKYFLFDSKLPSHFRYHVIRTVLSHNCQEKVNTIQLQETWILMHPTVWGGWRTAHEDLCLLQMPACNHVSWMARVLALN